MHIVVNSARTTMLHQALLWSEHFHINYVRIASSLRGNRRSTRLAGKEPRYMGLLCCIKGEDPTLDTTGVSQFFQRDEYFLTSVVQDDISDESPATRYLNIRTYSFHDGIIGDIHSYDFSAKVHTYDSDNLTYKDI